MSDSELLANENLVLEMCNLTISNADKFDPRVVAKAFEVKKETEEHIRSFLDGRV